MTVTARDHIREQQAAVRASDDAAALLQAAADLLRCPVEDVVSRATALAAEVKLLEAAKRELDEGAAVNG